MGRGKSRDVLRGHETEGYCYMREKGFCTALEDTEFKDGKCHFRKDRARGVNLYDLHKKRY